MNTFLRNNRGFTLLELLIVAGIFMLVLIPVLSVFTSSHESYLVQDDISATQQNIRAALMYLRKDIRMAGAGLGDEFLMFNLFDEDPDLDLGEMIQVYGISAGNAVGPNESDELIVRYVNFDEGACQSNGATAPYCDELPRLSLPGGMPEDSAIANVSNDLKESPYDKWNQDCECGPDKYDHSPGQFDIPVIISSPDGKRSEVLVVTKVLPNPNTLQNHRVQNFEFRDKVFTIENKSANLYPPGSTISYFNIEAFQRVRYFLGGDNDDTLMRQVNDNDPMPLADGIEDLQFDYLGDFNNDGSMEVSGAPEWYNMNYNFGTDGNFTDEDDQEDVRMVRIRILARTSKEWRELGKTDSPDLDDQDSTGTKNDHFRRRVIEQDVQVRNLSL